MKRKNKTRDGRPEMGAADKEIRISVAELAFSEPPEAIEFAKALAHLADEQKNANFREQMHRVADVISGVAERFTRMDDGSWISVEILGLRRD